VASSIWGEANAATSVAIIDAKYGKFPVGSTERFVADYSVLSCGSLTSIGLEKFAYFAEQSRKRLPASPAEEEAQKQMLKRYGQQCQNYMATLTGQKVASGMAELKSQSGVESKALALLDKAIAPAGASLAIRESAEVVFSQNPFAVETMAQVWAHAARQQSSAMDGTIFATMSPSAIESSWYLAACDLGMDCGKHHDLLRLNCLTLRRCLADSVASYFEQYALSPSEFAQATKVSQDLVAALKNRNAQTIGIRGGSN
jgi:hypothetical protein